MNHDVDKILRFLVVVEAGTIHAAAEKLHVSQPALTKAMMLLEHRLGVQLLERHPKGVSVTAEGEILCRYAKSIRDELNLAKMELRGINASDYGGRLRIGAGTVWATSIISSVLSELQNDFPNLTVEIEMGINAEMLPKLANGQLDIFFGAREDEILPSNISYEPEISISHHLVCSADHPIMQIDNLTSVDIFKYPFVIYRNEHHLVRNVLQSLGDIADGSVNIAIWSQSYIAAVKLVESGNYLSVFARSDIEDFQDQDSLMSPLEISTNHLESGIYYRNILKKSRPFIRLLELVRRLTTKQN